LRGKTPIDDLKEDRFVRERSGVGSLNGWRDKMRFRWSLGLVALLAVSFSAGCSMTNPTVRGQGPENAGPIIGTAPGYGDLKNAPYMGKGHNHDFQAYSGIHDNNHGYEGGFYSGPEGYYTERNQPYMANGAGGPAAAGCPQCNNGQNCPQDGCQRCGRGCGYRNGMPQHYQTQQIDYPQNMVYPQQGVPSGMVQYPYYTLRGPTDFFMK
jgi:hypothetical protein